MKLSDKKGVQYLIQFLAIAGIKNVVLSPGSRNAPLSLSFLHHGGFNIRMVPDERSAAYFALGISLHTQEPTVICCTSGTAVLNYAPAIAEAYYQHVPLLVITADRPEKWIDQGDGQTIRQHNVFSNFIEKSFHFSGDSTSYSEIKSVLEDVFTTLNSSQNPAHLNITLEEPLYHLSETDFATVPAVSHSSSEKYLSVNEKEIIHSVFTRVNNVLILCGQLLPDSELNSILKNISRNKNMVVLTENTSNLFAEHFITCIDRTIDGFTEEEKNDFKPELLITLGGAVISKKVKSWLRKFKPDHHWKVGEHDLSMNTYECKTHTMDVNEKHFLESLENVIPRTDFYFEKWRLRNEAMKLKHDSFVPSADFSDLKVFSVLSKEIPSGTNLHLGNSSGVRYAQLFDARNDLNYFSNRGVSGIDGCTSTAAGMADASDQNITLISGDISFFYDSNAFWNDHLKNLKVIVINNGGGGIFRIIDQPENIKDTELLFETRHHRKAEGIAHAFGIKYLSANDESSLEKAVKQLYADNLPTILEIFTPTEKNPLILKNYFTFLKTK